MHRAIGAAEPSVRKRQRGGSNCGVDTEEERGTDVTLLARLDTARVQEATNLSPQTQGP
jgi:hypothetical protein